VTAPAIRKPRWPLALAIVCAIAAGTVTWAWNTDSGYYAFLPDEAHPTAPIITVPGEKPQAKGAGLYFVDVSVLKANEVQRLWAEHLVDGASLVPADHLLSPGENDQERLVCFGPDDELPDEKYRACKHHHQRAPTRHRAVLALSNH